MWKSNKAVHQITRLNKTKTENPIDHLNRRKNAFEKILDTQVGPDLYPWHPGDGKPGRYFILSSPKWAVVV